MAFTSFQEANQALQKAAARVERAATPEQELAAESAYRSVFLERQQLIATHYA